MVPGCSEVVVERCGGKGEHGGGKEEEACNVSPGGIILTRPRRFLWEWTGQRRQGWRVKEGVIDEEEGPRGSMGDP